MPDSCNHRQLTSGSEPVYNAAAYLPFKRSKNCFAWAMQDRSPSPEGVKSTPGLKAGIEEPLNLRSCRDTQARVLADNPRDIYVAKECEPCKRGFYRGWLALEKDAKDFHLFLAHSAFKHRVETGDTYASLAAFYGVSEAKLRGWNRDRPLMVGDTIFVKVSGASHKRGLTDTTVKDSCGRFLRDPAQAARDGCLDYGDLVYSVMCKPMCIRLGGLSTR